MRLYVSIFLKCLTRHAFQDVVMCFKYTLFQQRSFFGSDFLDKKVNTVNILSYPVWQALTSGWNAQQYEIQCLKYDYLWHKRESQFKMNKCPTKSIQKPPKNIRRQLCELDLFHARNLKKKNIYQRKNLCMETLRYAYKWYLIWKSKDSK